jgi:putative nucleotidyltransferase with HDIG domain
MMMQIGESITLRYNLPESYSRFAGKRLNKNLLTRSGVLCLPAYSVLNIDNLQQLYDLGIQLLDTDIETDSVSLHRVIGSATEEIKDIFKYAHQSDQVLLHSLEHNIVPMINDIVKTQDPITLLLGLEHIDNYTFRHSVAVGMLATMIGQWLKLKDEDLLILSSASLLHDIGKVKIPPHILNKTEKLTVREYEEIKKHTIYGYQLIQNSSNTLQQHAIIALQHHERLDGSGYPYGVKAEKIGLLCRIVSIADVFHAMCSRRTYKTAMPFYEVINEMYDQAFGKFDPTIMAKFTNKVMNALIGNEVTLSNGEVGKIIKINNHDLSNPLVLINERFVDLSKEPLLNIVRI